MADSGIQARPASRSTGLPYLPGLDGLRALAVIAVVMYHAGLGVAGGFLGVETFFVLSGFLVTALLLAEWRNQGSVDLKHFWLRRARRLFPALGLLLAGITAYTAVALPAELTDFGSDLLAAVGYVMNWHLILAGQSYFDPMLRPPLLQHLWSLAIEEQFYLLWPLLFVGGMRLLGARGMLLATLALAGASVAAMALLYEPGSDPSRLYYGTDTRASGLLLGAALAFVWSPGQVPGAERRWFGRVLDLIGFLALAGLGWAYLMLFAAHPLLYQGGIPATALITAALVAAATHPQARLLTASLGWAPLRWIGMRSYGIYLWHWPIFELTRPTSEGSLAGWPLAAFQIALVLGISALSYRFIEQPIRSGAITWRALRTTLAGNLKAFAQTAQLQQNPHLAPARQTRSGPAQTAAAHPNQHGTQATRLPKFPIWRGTSVTVVTVLVFSIAAHADPIPMASGSASRGIAAVTANPTPQLSSTPRSTIVAEPDIVALAETATIESAESVPTQLAPSLRAELPAPSQPALEPFSPELAQQLRSILDATVKDGAIPGAVASVNIPGAEPWTGASGLADRSGRVAMTADTRVRIASISKMFTAVVVLQLVEEGKIGLDDPMSTWLPGLVPGGRRITVRNLLQHTTGLYDYLEDRNYVTRAYQTPNRIWAPEELVKYAVQFPPAFTPGTQGQWDYSSTNFVILGMIVEKVTGNLLAAEIRSRILEPLQLNATFFTPQDSVVGPQAHGYSRSVDQTRVAMSMVYATASIVSTIGDVRAFAEGLFGGKLLKPETMALMQGFVNGKGQYNMPRLEYGFGLMRNQLPAGPGPNGKARPAEVVTVLGHIGGFGGFRSALWYAPESGIIVAIGMNQAATDPNILATRLFDAALAGTGR